MMDAVKAGGDRQELHEKIRTLSMEAGRNVKERGLENNLLELIAEDAAFNLSLDDLKKAMDPARYVGRAREQVDAYLEQVIRPLLEENNGTFLWTLDETGADVKKLTSIEELPGAAQHAQRFPAKTGDLVSWLTGYRDAAQIWPERSQELTEAMAAVDVVNGVFLDEIV